MTVDFLFAAIMKNRNNYKNSMGLLYLKKYFFCVFSTVVLIELSDKYVEDYFARYNKQLRFISKRDAILLCVEKTCFVIPGLTRNTVFLYSDTCGFRFSSEGQKEIIL
jgi:hypothetical protein